MNRRERRAAGKSPEIAPGKAGALDPAALYETGMMHLRAGRTLDAQVCGQQALTADPEHADSLHLMSLITIDAEHFDLAAEWARRAVAQDPKPQYLFTLGSVLRQQKQFEEALEAFEQAARLKPEAIALWSAVANVMVDLNRTDRAAAAFAHVLKLNPRDRDAAYNAGSLLQRSGRAAEALPYLQMSDDLQPNHAPTLQMRALALHDLERSAEALADIERAHGLDPASAEICNNAGAVLHRLGRDDEALIWFDRALQRKPAYVGALCNKGAALSHLHRFDDALAMYRRARAIDPGYAEAEWGLALLNLLRGNFEAGWTGREVRWKVPDLPIAHFDYIQPMWLGNGSVEGKTVLVHVDEGLGDTIQYVRYVAPLAARGARVVLVVPASLCGLLSKLPGVAQCLPMGSEFPAFDMYCPIGSLPLAFGTRLETIPADVPYLPAPEPARVQAWEARLGSHDRLRVGLVWSGNREHWNDHNRSVPLGILSELFDLDAAFVSLQKDPSADDRALLARSEVIDLTGELTDFTETAALMSRLDLVISVDTSVAHLAGALGRPVWTLLPYTPDYRWLLERDDSPWYPTMRLFRQSASRSYAEVITRVRGELSERIAKRE
jgi:tetratricopeptide (TPR) repeat protein